MKIGTDGVLLGAWASIVHNPNSILDIGAGTGVLSLMLAQRSLAENIEALEIDEDAHEQCVENFEASSWADRLFCYHAGLDEFVEEIEEPYDLIISNPPFFPSPSGGGANGGGGPTIENARKKARFYDSLPFDELLEGASKLMAKNGCFTTIIPYKEEANFIELAASFNLFPKRILRVKGNPSAAIKRSLLEFSFNKSDIQEDELTIEIGRHQYTKEYIELTKDFYLKM